MKRLLTILFAGLLLTAFVAPVFAWEYSMKGEFEYRVRYFGRTGDHDLFGYAPSQNAAGFAGPVGAPGTPGVGGTDGPEGTFVGFAGPNIYATGATGTSPDDTGASSGLLATRGGFSRYNSDALYDDVRLTMYPEIRVNNAIRVHGVYTVGGVRNKFRQRNDTAGNAPLERYYQMNESLAAYNTAAIGSWEQFRATIQMPIGILSIGVKDFPFGTGASLANHTRANSILSVIPYGPFRFIHGLWYATTAAGFATSGRDTFPDSYVKPWLFQGLLVAYDAGDLSAGGGSIVQITHKDAASPTRARPFGDTAAPTTAGGVPTWAAANGFDQSYQQYMVFAKYFNGRFFANAEYYWNTFDRHYNRNTNFITTPLDPIAVAAPLNYEGYIAFAEAGCVAGPTKMSFMYGRRGGSALTNGVNIAGLRNKGNSPANLNYQVMEPYNYLMFQTYGGGNQSFSPDGTGELYDAEAYAVRLDYAVASNLNFFGTYMYANRLERNSTFKGGVLNNGAFATGAGGANAINQFTTQYYGAPTVAVVLGPGTGTIVAAPGTTINPYVDNNYLGWEGNVGVDWKLLEGLTMNMRYAYWQPGDWFTQAYQAIVPLGNGTVTANGRLESRDPINAFHGSMIINF